MLILEFLVWIILMLILILVCLEIYLIIEVEVLLIDFNEFFVLIIIYELNCWVGVW